MVCGSQPDEVIPSWMGILYGNLLSFPSTRTDGPHSPRQTSLETGTSGRRNKELIATTLSPSDPKGETWVIVVYLVACIVQW